MPSRTASKVRPELVRAVFRACDADGDGRLSSEEMRSFAVLTGFQGSDAQWEREFAELCADGGRRIAAGVSAPLFAQLVDDPSDGGLFCADDELRQLLGTLEERTRSALAQAVFRALDSDGVGRLSPEQFLLFAFHARVRADDAAWMDDFGRLCGEHGDDPAQGIGRPTFLAFVEIASKRWPCGSGKQLRRILRRLTGEDALAPSSPDEWDPACAEPAIGRRDAKATTPAEGAAGRPCDEPLPPGEATTSKTVKPRRRQRAR